jgi:hypothetical protein
MELKKNYEILRRSGNKESEGIGEEVRGGGRGRIKAVMGKKEGEELGRGRDGSRGRVRSRVNGRGSSRGRGNGMGSEGVVVVEGGVVSGL